MTLLRIALRSLGYYWRTHVAVAFGVAIAAATITGSLIVGDSVRGSVRDVAMSRLGNIDYAMAATTLFPEDLARRLAAQPDIRQRLGRIVPVLLLRGSAKSNSDAVAPSVNVIGVDDDFWLMYGKEGPQLASDQVAVNAALAADLSLHEGDRLFLRIDRPGAIPSESLFAQRSAGETTRNPPVVVSRILPDAGVGGFGLDVGTAVPRNIFISRAFLQRILERPGRANVLLGELSPKSRDDASADAAFIAGLTDSTTLADYGLKLSVDAKRGHVSIESDGVVLSTDQIAAAEALATQHGCPTAQRISMYLAEEIRRPRTTGVPPVPSSNPADRPAGQYAILAGIAPTPQFRFTSATTRPLNADGIFINDWLAQRLPAQVGDVLEIEYFAPTWESIDRTATKQLTVRGIVEMSGPADDPTLVPDIQGITSAGRVTDWKAPFKVRPVSPEVEKYWTDHHGTPKAFVSMDAIHAMWASGPEGDRADWITSVRITPPAGTDLATFAKTLERELPRRLDPKSAGLTFRPVRRLALASSSGSVDFAQLFLAMSIFLIAAAAGLAGMLMRLLAERRAGEAGIMLATGLTARRVRRAIVFEGAIVSVIGAAVGVPMGLGYAAGIITALRSWWIGAVGTTALWLHVDSLSLAIGGAAGVVIGLLSVAWGARAVTRRPTLQLLGGWQAIGVLPATGKRGPIVAVLAIALLLAGVAMMATSATGAISPPIGFFTGGFALLVAAMLAAWLVLARAMRRRGDSLSIALLALRSAAANRGRSLLAIGLFAAASFIIVAVAANQRDFSRLDVTNRDSGAGGFSLRAISSLPVRYDLRTPAGRKQLGFEPADEETLKGTQIVPFFMSRGEDASCLNLAKPTIVQTLGVSSAMIDRGGFTVTTSRDSTGNPWPILAKPAGDGPIPVFGDADSVEWILHSGLGNDYPLPTPSGRQLTARFDGLIHGSIFASQILMGRDNFARTFPGNDLPRYFLIATPPGHEDAVAKLLRERMGDMGLEVRTTRELLSAYVGVQNTYLSVFLALGGLGVLLGSAGLLAVLLRNAFERRGEFALMLATGFQPRDLSQLLVLENAGLLAAGLVAGSLCALLAVAPQIASTDIHVNWPALVLWPLGIFVFGLLCCVFAARAAIGGKLLGALREE